METCFGILTLHTRKRETHQRDFPRDVPRDVARDVPQDVARDVASVFQTHYFIIGTTYQRDDVRDRQRYLFQNCYNSVAPVVAPAVALTCGLTCCVGRRVGRRAW